MKNREKREYITYEEYERLEEEAEPPINNTSGIAGVDFPLSVKDLRKKRKKKNE